MPLFETHIVVDWSARSKPSPARPSRDSIWWAAVREGCALEPRYERTRHDAVENLTAFIAGELDAERRVLAGFDFPFGYPAGVAARLTGRASATTLWNWLAERIEDSDGNANNRFAVAQEMNRCWPGLGPFWGRPAGWEYPGIPTRQKDLTCRDGHPPERRIADLRASEAKTVWQSAYAGSVGSQVLVGLPALKRLLTGPAHRRPRRGLALRYRAASAGYPRDAARPRGNLPLASQARGRRMPGGRGNPRPRPGSGQRSGICAAGQAGAALPHCLRARPASRRTNAI